MTLTAVSTTLLHLYVHPNNKAYTEKEADTKYIKYIISHKLFLSLERLFKDI